MTSQSVWGRVERIGLWDNGFRKERVWTSASRLKLGVVAGASKWRDRDSAGLKGREDVETGGHGGMGITFLLVRDLQSGRGVAKGC